MNEAMTILKLMLECIANGKLVADARYEDEVLRLTKLAFPPPAVLCSVVLYTTHEELMTRGQKIYLIKVIREYTNLGLKEAKELTEKATGYLTLARLPEEKAYAMMRDVQSLGLSAEVQ